MGYADRARRFLAQRQPSAHLEILESTQVVSAERETTGHVKPDVTVWWTDSPEAVAPILHLPPPTCIAPIACSRLVLCERHLSGAPCLIRQSADEPVKAPQTVA